jgi:hypothetical protein
MLREKMNLPKGSEAKRLPKIYIYVGKNRNNAAGIKVLHLLFKGLEDFGLDVRIISHSFKFPLSKKIPGEIKFTEMARDILSDRKIFVIYPESVGMDLMGVGMAVWYLLSLPNELHSIRLSRKDQKHTFSYSENISKSWKSNGPVVHLSTINEEELKRYRSQKSIIDIIYGGKYLDFYRNKLPVSLAEIPILSRNRNEFPRDVFLRQLATAKTLHCFENTVVALEAIFLQTQVVFHLNSNFPGFILDKELGGISVKNGVGTIYDTQKSKKAYLDYLEGSLPILDFVEYISQLDEKYTKSRRSILFQLFFIFPNMRWLVHRTIFLARHFSKGARN